jgi:hypothetical protein
MIKLRVKSCLQRIPDIADSPYVIPQNPIYTSIHDLDGNLNIFFLDQRADVWRILRFFRAPSLMHWTVQDTGFQIQSKYQPYTYLDSNNAFIKAKVSKDNVIHVAFASTLHRFSSSSPSAVKLAELLAKKDSSEIPQFVQYATFPPNQASTSWTSLPDFNYRAFIGIVTALELNVSDFQAPMVLIAHLESIPPERQPIISQWFPNFSTQVSDTDSMKFTPQFDILDIAAGKYLDTSLDRSGQAVAGIFCRIDPPQPAPIGSMRRSDLTDPDIFQPSNSLATVSTRPMISLKALFVGVRSDGHGLAPLLFAISRGSQAGDLLDQAVIFILNTQYATPSPPETFRVIFQDKNSPIPSGVSPGKALWIDAVIEDLSNTFDPNGIVQGTNFRVHVFGLFRNDQLNVTRLMHTWSFDAGGSGSGGVVEVSPGIFEYVNSSAI